MRANYTFLRLFSLVFLLSATTTRIIFANSIQSVRDGNWNSTTTWVGGVIPTANDDVIITHNVTLDVAPTVASLTLQGVRVNASHDGVLTGPYSITITGDLNVSNNPGSGVGLNNDGNVSVRGNFVWSGGVIVLLIYRILI